MDVSFFSLTFILALHCGPTSTPQERIFLGRVARSISNEENQ